MPLAVLWTEADFVREREQSRISTETVLIREAIVDVLGGGDGYLNSVLKRFNGE